MTFIGGEKPENGKYEFGFAALPYALCPMLHALRFSLRALTSREEKDRNSPRQREENIYE
jgi:hypothetical protein